MFLMEAVADAQPADAIACVQVSLSTPQFDFHGKALSFVHMFKFAQFVRGLCHAGNLIAGV